MQDSDALKKEVISELKNGNVSRAKEIIKMIQGKRIELNSFFDALRWSSAEEQENDREVIIGPDLLKLLSDIETGSSLNET